jgi:chromosome transmission fidelity protein 18
VPISVDGAIELTRCRPLDTLTAFQMDKSTIAQPPPVRYAVRQVLDQELRKEQLLQSSMARQARSSVLAITQNDDDDKENEPRLKARLNADPPAKAVPVKRDFFGRIINEARPVSSGKAANQARKDESEDGGRVWVSFHEGFSNAVRKPITLKELMDSF